MVRGVSAAVVAVGVGLGLACAPPVNADDYDGFINYLVQNGKDVSTPTQVHAAIKVGESACVLLEANQNVAGALNDMVDSGMPFDDARLVLIGSVAYLCPELTSIRP